MIAVLSGVAGAQHSGDVPPALVWNKLKGNCPARLDWTSLRGNVVVVSFTHGVFVPDEVAEWNEAAGNFPGDPVLFMQVVGGSEFLLDQALKQAAFPGCILFDSELANQRNFKLPRLLPRTVVVDQLGVIAGYSRGGPDEHGVRSVLNYRAETGLSEVPPPVSGTGAGQEAYPTYEVHISPASRTELRSLGQLVDPDTYIARNHGLPAIISDLWETPGYRIAFPEKLDGGSYDVTAHIPGADRDRVRQMVQEAVERRFGLRVGKEERIERVYMLTASGTSSPHLAPATSGEKQMSAGGENSVSGTAHTMQEMARMFAELLSVPAFDETGLKGKYNYSASSKLSGTDAVFDMALQLGLQLTQAERPIEMLVVRKVQ